MGAKKAEPGPNLAPRWAPWVRLRPRVWASLGALAVCGLMVNLAWRHYAPVIARHEQYQITAQDIVISPPPAWIRADIRAEVFSTSGLADSLSILDDWTLLCDRLTQAFRLHPWVASVGPIRRRLPSTLEIELAYRKPVAAVESTDAAGIAFLPVDVRAIRLPEKDLTDIELRYLPRISGISGRPQIGDVWNDVRVIDGAKLADALSDVWQQLRLVELIPVARPASRSDTSLVSFEITTSGGTRILWGVAPGHERDAGESPLETKRKRLLHFAAQNGSSRPIDGPELVDVRSDLIVTPRSARKKSQAGVIQPK